jgi:hypothetical protein
MANMMAIQKVPSGEMLAKQAMRKKMYHIVIVQSGHESSMNLAEIYQEKDK